MPTRHRLTATVACALALLLAVATPAHASFQGDVAALVNVARSQQGLAALTSNADMDAVAQAWAEHLAETGELAHNPGYASQIPGGWRSAAENVAYSSRPTASGMHGQLMDSSGHRANILGELSHLGVGYAVDDEGGGWLVEVFGRYPGSLPGDRGGSAPPPTTPPSEETTPAPSGETSAPAQPSPSATTPTVPAGWLGPGSSGAEVRTLQQDLTALGYPTAADGSYGERTRAQVVAFQRDAGLQADGMVGPATSDAIAAALESAASPEPTETASEPTEVAEEETPEPPATRAAAAARTAVVSDVVPTDAGPPPADDEGGPRTGALVGVLAAAIAALAALLVVRRRLVRS